MRYRVLPDNLEIEIVAQVIYPVTNLIQDNSMGDGNSDPSPESPPIPICPETPKNDQEIDTDDSRPSDSWPEDSTWPEESEKEAPKTENNEGEDATKLK